MHLPSLVLSAALLAGCASSGSVPAASPTPSPAPAPAGLGAGVEVRHMYLFAPGKEPVKIVEREDAHAMRDAVSIEPPPAL